MFDNEEGQRFEVVISMELKSRGDFGCMRIGGLYRDIRESCSDAKEILEGIEQHVGGVDYLDYKVVDVFGEYEDTPSYKAEQLRNKSIEEQKKELKVDNRWTIDQVNGLLMILVGDENIPEDYKEDLLAIVVEGIKL